jgi:D-alanine-D-alanine ligase
MKIAVLANLKEDAPVSKEDPPGRWDDLDDRKTVDAILASLQELGHTAQYFPATIQSVQALQNFAPDLCFNSAEGHFGDSREAQMPAILDSLRIPYTCAGVLGMSLSHNKAVAKKMFRDTRIPTANFVVVRYGIEIPSHKMNFPLFVKPGVEGSSIGINDYALVRNEEELIRQVRYVRSITDSLILVEQYIEGREFTIGILGDEVLPIVEIISPTGFYSSAQKEDLNSAVRRVCPAELSAEKTTLFKSIAKRAMNALHLSDICRMDLRMDAQGNPYVLEVNPIPLMDPDPNQASLVFAAAAAGYSYTDIVRKIIESAAQRWNLQSN